MVKPKAAFAAAPAFSLTNIIVPSETEPVVLMVRLPALSPAPPITTALNMAEPEPVMDALPPV
jgi:hypothetical protein